MLAFEDVLIIDRAGMVGGPVLVLHCLIVAVNESCVLLSHAFERVQGDADLGAESLACLLGSDNPALDGALSPIFDLDMGRSVAPH